LIRYDERGCGLSDWEVPCFTFDDWVDDLETVVDAAGLDRFSLLGVSQGGAVAVAQRSPVEPAWEELLAAIDSFLAQ
jgi:pimeloyl-ACP methyl ester carboxylesterase